MGLTFAALLITQQGSIFCGLMLRTASQITDTTGADLWVMDPNVLQVDDSQADDREQPLPRPRGRGGLVGRPVLYKGNARAKVNNVGGSPEKVIEQVILLGLDDSSMVGAPPPERILVGGSRTSASPTRSSSTTPGSPSCSRAAPPEDPVRRRLCGTPRRLLHRQGDRDERPPGDHRRHLRGLADVPVEPGRSTRPIPGPRATSPRSGRSSATSSPRWTEPKNPDGSALTEQRIRLRREVAGEVKRQTGLMALSSQEFIDKTIDYYLNIPASRSTSGSRPSSASSSGRRSPARRSTTSRSRTSSSSGPSRRWGRPTAGSSG